MTTTADLSHQSDRPRRSALPHDVLIRLAGHEYERFGETLSALRLSDGAIPTACPGWDVRAMSSHVLGMAEMAAGLFEGRRQQKAARARGGVFIHALTAVQVDERASMSLDEITRRFQAVAPKATRARRRLPGFIRGRRMPVDQPVGGHDEAWSIGYLMDTILTRDVWMHRLDVAAALGTEPRLTPDHDGVLVDDVVREWASRHGQACRVRLTGAAGGQWMFGAEGEVIEMDAVAFCRALARRSPTEGLLDVEVPF